jgi:hypothetical protein
MNLNNPPFDPDYKLPDDYVQPADPPVTVAEVEYTRTYINPNRTVSVETSVLTFTESVDSPNKGYTSQQLTLTINGGAPGTWVSYTGDAVGSIQLNSNGFASIKMSFLIAGEYAIALYFEGTAHKQLHLLKIYSPTVEIPVTAEKNLPFIYSVSGAIPNTELKINDFAVGNFDNEGSLSGTVTVAIPGNYSFTFSSDSWTASQKITVC